MSDSETFKGWVAKVPVAQRALYLRALQGKVSRSQAIKAKCYECCGWDRKVDGMDLIGSCPVRRCPLWAVRPFQKRKAVSAVVSAQAAEGGV